MLKIVKMQVESRAWRGRRPGCRQCTTSKILFIGRIKKTRSEINHFRFYIVKFRFFSSSNLILEGHESQSQAGPKLGGPFGSIGGSTGGAFGPQTFE